MKDFLIPVNELHKAHREHMAGWSLRALARMRWKGWGYASPDSAHEGLRNAMKVLGLEVRSPVEGAVLANTIHGHMREAYRNPGDPGHDRLNEHRRHLQALKSLKEAA